MRGGRGLSEEWEGLEGGVGGTQVRGGRDLREEWEGLE